MRAKASPIWLLFWATLFAGCMSPSKQAQVALRELPSQAPCVELLARDGKSAPGRKSSGGNSSVIKTVSLLIEALSLYSSESFE
jgi:hypothetical protein